MGVVLYLRSEIIHYTMLYPVRTPWLLQQVYSDCIWRMPTNEKKIYLSFDDGPHPVATPFVLDQLKKYGAKATFFCIGKNVAAFPEIYQQVLDAGHAVGNHTNNHLNGWKVTDKEYFDNVIEARKLIDSKLFRPPYGRATKFQIRQLQESAMKMKIVMWTMLAADFDQAVSREKSTDALLRRTKAGDIILFHDSEKAFPKMSFALPSFLRTFSEKGFQFDLIR